MAKALYTVKIIRKNREKDYYDFWERGVEINASGEKLHSDLVGFTEDIEARNKKEAESLVSQKYPGLTIDVAATMRHPV